MICVISYDENLRIWDRRRLYSPLTEIGVGGGVWKLKWHPNAALQQYLLCACMHNGFTVVNVHNQTHNGSDPLQTSSHGLNDRIVVIPSSSNYNPSICHELLLLLVVVQAKRKQQWFGLLLLGFTIFTP